MTLIIGKSVATAEQMAAYLLSVNPEPQIKMEPVAFCRLFLYIGAIEGVRGDVLFAQSCKETGNFKFKGTVKAHQNNYAGLGTTDNSTPGATFPDEATGILAQAQHAKGYEGSPLSYDCVDPRYQLLVKYNKIGTAQHWEELGGTWAVPGYDVNKYVSLDDADDAHDSYGYQIMNILNKILNTSVESDDHIDTDKIEPVPDNKNIRYKVQVGAFTKKGNAENKKAQLEASGYDTMIVQVGQYHKVQTGSFKMKERAITMMNKLKSEGHKAIIAEVQM